MSVSIIVNKYREYGIVSKKVKLRYYPNNHKALIDAQLIHILQRYRHFFNHNNYPLLKIFNKSTSRIAAAKFSIVIRQNNELQSLSLIAVRLHLDSGKDVLGSIGNVGRDNAAIGRKKGIGAVAEVFGKTQRTTLICK